MTTTKPFISVIKRTGEKVSYDSEKILLAIRKAFVSSSVQVDKAEINSMLQDIETLLAKKYTTAFVHIEKIQDAIEESLMHRKFFSVAKNFIIYRQQHAEKRLAKTLSQQEKVHSIKVYKRDGSTETFNLNKVIVTLRNASQGLHISQVPLDPIVLELEKNVFDGINSKDIEEALILSTISFVERDPNYGAIAAKLLLQKLYREVFDFLPNTIEYIALEKTYKEQFVLNIKKGVERGYLSKDLLEYNLEEVAQHIDVSRDQLLSYLGIRTLYERYFVKDENSCIETPQAFWMRVSMGLAVNEKNKLARTIEFYNLISSLRYVPSTPTLFHSGLSHPQLSSCYISTITDDLGHIFKCIGDNAQMAKWSGGIGNDWTPIRATNAMIKSTHVESQGVVPFLKIANDTTLAINRSGKRRGATCAYLETWHLDIEDFLDLRRNTGDDRRRTHDMNTANWIPDLFMKRVEADAEWTLFSPNETPDLHDSYGARFEEKYVAYEALAKEGKINNFKTLSASKLWKKMLTRLFETGHPWITFKDPCNIRSPQDHVGVVHSSNLCTEITLNNSAEETAVCNLGSINLSKHVTKDGFNQYLLIDTIKTAMHMLDNVIDINFYPTKEAKKSNLRHRPVGLGIMGLQDALYMLRLSFSAEETMDFMDKTMELVSYYAILSSSEIAKEKGAYESFKGSKWDRGILPFDTIALLEKERGQEIHVNKNQSLDWNIVRDHIKQYGMRNSNIMAIAPTATISSIAGCFPCIEPIYKNIYVKSNMTGEFTIINEYLVKDLRERGLWTSKMLDKIKYYDGNIDAIEEIPQELKTLYKETFEIDPITLLKLTAIRAKWIDQSQSHNVFMKGLSGKQLHDIYMQAWKMGLKTTYYLRTLGATQIEKSTLNAKEYGYTQKRDYHALDSKENIVPLSSESTKETEKASVASEGVRKELLLVSSDSEHARTEGMPASKAGIETVQDNISPQKEEGFDFRLEETNAASLVGKACTILDPDCESCQ